MKKKKIKVAIYGMGLIGGSLGLALKTKGYERIGIGRNPRKLALAKKMGAVDYITTDLKAGVSEADIIVLGLPVDLIVPMLKRIKPWIKKNTLVTDVGSVKGSIMDGARHILPHRFVGSHPMAGSEKSGVRYARKDLFHGAGCVIVPGKNPLRALQSIKKMWRETGARIMTMDKQTHDHLVAVCSHLPHILAYAMMHYMMRISKKNKNIIHTLAGSFKDMTRVAMSDPVLWSQIIKSNSGHIHSSMHEFNRMVMQLLRNPHRFETVFKQARNARKKL